MINAERLATHLDARMDSLFSFPVGLFHPHNTPILSGATRVADGPSGARRSTSDGACGRRSSVAGVKGCPVNYVVRINSEMERARDQLGLRYSCGPIFMVNHLQTRNYCSSVQIRVTWVSMQTGGCEKAEIPP